MSGKLAGKSRVKGERIWEIRGWGNRIRKEKGADIEIMVGGYRTITKPHHAVEK